MKINLLEIYNRNGLTKYTFHNRGKYKMKFNDKEQHMWEFALVLIQINESDVVYDFDDKKDLDYLKMHLKMFFEWSSPEDFTFEEWLDYMKDK